ncbi:MAG: hypothetical protein F2619_01970 [Actinobacteria bacterium]|uniref:Unannotated protein n=1 Tax=freshwater metagenome TaxID=449393 RepID=A0A6J6JT78_9ZZZZ|nr:hypothetical protein [Actinomycetota bacterium]
MAKYKNTKQIAKLAKKEISDSKLHKYLIVIPLIALAIKFVTMGNIQGGIWLGADGDNYLVGVNGLLADGFLSKEGVLSYWPAGYPLLLWPFALHLNSVFFYLVGAIQSVFFAFATYFFTAKMAKSSLKGFAFWTAVILSFNPTLSLSSLAIGYEAPIAACFMMIAGTILSTLNKPIDKKFWIAVASVGGWFSLATFMQPRFLLIAIIIAIVWAVRVSGKKNRLRIASLVISIMMVAPAIMIFRNAASIDKATISTNLGVTMRIGAGPETSGGYVRSGPEVPCEPQAPATVVTDNDLVVCVLKWYVTNPVDTARLSISKAILFWSPWSGPLSYDGTMARNPWLKISPVQKVATGSVSGQKLVSGPIGTAISYVWLFGQIALLFIGYRSIRRLGPKERFFANIVMVSIVLSWLISIGTIGDHRFRIPTMSMSLVLQVAALLAIRKKLNDKVG